MLNATEPQAVPSNYANGSDDSKASSELSRHNTVRCNVSDKSSGDQSPIFSAPPSPPLHKYSKAPAGGDWRQRVALKSKDCWTKEQVAGSPSPHSDNNRRTNRHVQSDSSNSGTRTTESGGCKLVSSTGGRIQSSSKRGNIGVANVQLPQRHAGTGTRNGFDTDGNGGHDATPKILGCIYVMAVVRNGPQEESW